MTEDDLSNLEKRIVRDWIDNLQVPRAGAGINLDQPILNVLARFTSSSLCVGLSRDDTSLVMVCKNDLQWNLHRRRRRVMVETHFHEGRIDYLRTFNKLISKINSLKERK